MKNWQSLFSAVPMILAEKSSAFVSIDLTDEGLHRVNHVILRVFQTIAMMKQQPFPEYVFDEVQRVNRIDYEYQKREDAFDTAMKMQDS